MSGTGTLIVTPTSMRLSRVLHGVYLTRQVLTSLRDDFGLGPEARAVLDREIEALSELIEPEARCA